MTTVLILGFLIGLQHAMEADHVSAVAALACRLNSTSGMIRQGVYWGIGHSLTLLAFAGVVFLFGQAIPGYAAGWLETAVAVMLMFLGADVLLRLRRENLHLHVHRHEDGVQHVHVHGHDDTLPHESDHGHEHADVPWRTLLVGMMHGLAGSAALLVLLVGAAQSLPLGIAYIALFGAGSIVGMVALSAAIAVPLKYSGRSLARMRGLVHGLVGCVTILVGLLMIIEHGRV